ncbi:MAG: M23 family metallopeptidase [Gemmatimonadetes bacterium]|nr:M23 family metallopeptidase [Gemmatimonadota bacterium]
MSPPRRLAPYGGASALAAAAFLWGCSLPLWPVEGPISSPFGLRLRGPLPEVHEGVDIRVPDGTSVLAMAGGRVLYAGAMAGYGLTVILQHDSHVRTVYAHLSELRVRKGEEVRGRQVVGLSGRTGNAQGAHLHFEIRRWGCAEDPVPLLGRPPARRALPRAPRAARAGVERAFSLAAELEAGRSGTAKLRGVGAAGSLPDGPWGSMPPDYRLIRFVVAAVALRNPLAASVALDGAGGEAAGSALLPPSAPHPVLAHDLRTPPRAGRRGRWYELRRRPRISSVPLPGPDGRSGYVVGFPLGAAGPGRRRRAPPGAGRSARARRAGRPRDGPCSTGR